MSEQSTFSALVVGVSIYHNNQPLHKCAADAEAIRDALINDLFLPPESVTCLYGLVTKASFAEVFSQFLDSPARTGILYFSGHGSQNDCSCNLRFADETDSALWIVKEAKNILNRYS